MKSLQLTQPHLLVMVGIPGSGKSCFANKFAETFGAPCVRYERIRPLTYNDEGAREITNLQIEELVKTHQTIVIDGATDSRVERMELTHLARTSRYETMLIWVQTDPATSKSRVLKGGKANNKPRLSSEEYDQLLRRFTPPNLTEKAVVISGKHTYATQAKIVLKKLSEPRAAISSTAESSHSRPNEPTRRSITIR